MLSNMRSAVPRPLKRVPVIPMVKTLPEQPLKSVPIRDLIHFPKPQSPGKDRGKIPVKGELHDSLFLIGRRESCLQSSLYFRFVFLMDRDGQPGIVLQLPVGVVQNFRIQRLKPRQNSTESLPEVHIVDRRADDFATRPPEPDGGAGAFVKFRVLHHPFEARPIPVDMRPVRLIQFDQKGADGLIILVAIAAEACLGQPIPVFWRCRTAHVTLGSLGENIPEYPIRAFRSGHRMRVHSQLVAVPREEICVGGFRRPRAAVSARRLPRQQDLSRARYANKRRPAAAECACQPIKDAHARDHVVDDHSSAVPQRARRRLRKSRRDLEHIILIDRLMRGHFQIIIDRNDLVQISELLQDQILQDASQR